MYFKKNILPYLLLFLAFEMFSQESNILSPNDTLPGQTIEINPTPRTQFKLGGAIWMSAAFQEWVETNQAHQRGFYFDQFRIAVSGEHGLKDQSKLKFSAQVRWWSYMFAVQHMWFGIEFNNHNEIRYGITPAPFGAMPSISSSFWYSINYYLGLESDHDAGLYYKFQNNGFDFQAGYFRNDEYNNPSSTNRWAPDLVVSGDQQNFERHQGNLRFAYTFGYDTKNSTEFGISGEYGAIKNQVISKNGTRWAGAFHYVGHYGNWNTYAQFSRYEYEPNNPDGVDDRTVQMGFFSDKRLVAAKANTVVAGVRRYWDLDWWLFNKMNAYIEYSTMLKDEDTFSDSRIINPGVVLEAGPFYLWFDLLAGQNSWWFNDSETNSGLGAGSGNNDKFEFRYNFSIQWYF